MPALFADCSFLLRGTPQFAWDAFSPLAPATGNSRGRTRARPARGRRGALLFLAWRETEPRKPVAHDEGKLYQESVNSRQLSRAVMLPRRLGLAVRAGGRGRSFFLVQKKTINEIGESGQAPCWTTHGKSCKLELNRMQKSGGSRVRAPFHKCHSNQDYFSFAHSTVPLFIVWVARCGINEHGQMPVPQT